MNISNFCPNKSPQRVADCKIGGHSAKGPDKRPLDPPAVVEFVVKDKDRFKSYLWSPYFFCTTTLVPQDGEPSKCDMLTGCLTSSLHIIQQDDKEKTCT